MARALSSTSISKYLEGGIYYNFLQYVKADKELAFEIRTKDEVMIYCQKNLLLRISHRKNTSDYISMLNHRYYTNRKDGLKLTSLLQKPSDLQDLHKVRQYFEEAKALCRTTSRMTNSLCNRSTRPNTVLFLEIILLLTWNGRQTRPRYQWNSGWKKQRLTCL